MDVFTYKLLCSLFFFLLFISLKVVSLTHTHTHKCRYPSIPDSMGNNSVMAFSYSEDLVYHAEYEGDEDYEVSENWLDCYNRKKGLFYLTRSC